MVYADSTFYKSNYLSGKAAIIDTAVFPFFERKAANYIKQNTFNRVSESSPTESVKMCCCELAELYFNEDKELQALSSGIKSEKVGEYSVSYDEKIAITYSYSQRRYDCICDWLLNTGLLYRGV
ncbi:MAG: hypothetical protein RSF40_07415 [Oscillospiraceae bacterium]